jgi:prepilin-type N-terminal cleavage/methylation domain-containing protein
MLVNKKNGFTLIEIIIALAILVIIAIPIANAFRQSADNNQKARQQLEATQLEQKIMEDVKKEIQTEDLATSGPALWSSDYPLVKLDDSDPGGLTFSSPDTYKITTDVSSDITTWEWKAKSNNDKYIVSISVEKGGKSQENKSTGTYDNEMNSPADSSVFKINDSSGEADVTGTKIVKLELNGSGLTMGLTNAKDSTNISKTFTSAFTKATVYILASVAPGSKNTVQIKNVYGDLDDFNINVIGNNDQLNAIKFELATDSAHLIKNIVRNDILDSSASGSAYANATTGANATRTVSIYTIRLKVCKKDSIDWYNPIVNSESKRTVRR